MGYYPELPSETTEAGMRQEKRWIVAGSYVIDADDILYINTAARWRGPAEGEEARDAWGEVPTSRHVEITGVEVVWNWLHEREPLRFPDGSREADDLRRFAQSLQRRPES